MSLTALILVIAGLPFWLKAEVAPKIVEKQSQQSSYLCYITPPKDWEVVDPTTLSKSVQIAFLKKTTHHFSPSINLAIEKTDLSLSEYLKVIRQIHESNRRNRWRKLGKVHTQSGMGQLTEIDTTTEFGAIRMLQLIVMHQGHAYIVTAAASKEEMPLFYKDFQTVFRTLQITSDLMSTIPQLEQRESLRLQSQCLSEAWHKHLEVSSEHQPSFDDPDFQKKHWLPFLNHVVHDYAEMGPHWQILMLKTTQERMLAVLASNKSEMERSVEQN